MVISKRGRPASTGVIGAAIAEARAARQQTGKPAARAESRAPAPAPMFYPQKGPARIPPHLCRPWRLADRPAGEFEHLDEMVASFNAAEQLQPVLVRPLNDPSEPSIRYELIFGIVRWRSALAAGTDLDVTVRTLDDREAFRAMTEENLRRRPISDYAKAMSYRAALEAKLFGSPAELATALQVSPGNLSKLLRLAEIPADVVGVFKSTRSISVRIGYAAAQAIAAGRRALVLADVPAIESGRMTVEQAEARWTEGQVDDEVPVAKPVQPARMPVRHVQSSGGKRLFSVRISKRATMIKLPAFELSDEFIERLRSMVEALLQDEEQPRNAHATRMRG